MVNEKVSEKKDKANTNVLSDMKDFITGPTFANGLAVILIIGSVAAIISIIIVYSISISSFNDLYKTTINNLSKGLTLKDVPSDKILDSLREYNRETNSSNTNLLSILLPVIGSWVAGIIVFYYGNKNFDKLSDAVKIIGSSPVESEKLGQLKVEEILEKFSQYKNVIKGKISELVGTKFKEIGGNSALLLTDDNNQPLGFLYKEDILKIADMNEEKINSIEKSFKDFFIEMTNSGKPVIDEITGNTWSGEKIIKNYAEVHPEDTLLLAQTKMKGISDKQKVRGLVINNQKQIVGIITYDLFSEVIK